MIALLLILGGIVLIQAGKQKPTRTVDNKRTWLKWFSGAKLIRFPIEVRHAALD